MSRSTPPKTAVTTPISTATIAGSPCASAICVPGAEQAQAQRVGPLHRALGEREVARRNAIAAMHSASSTHSQFACSTQKNGRRSSSTSRSVPPPNAVNPATSSPTASRALARRLEQARQGEGERGAGFDCPQQQGEVGRGLGGHALSGRWGLWRS